MSENQTLDFVVSLIEEQTVKTISASENASLSLKDGITVAIPSGTFSGSAKVTVESTTNITNDMIPSDDIKYHFLVYSHGFTWELFSHNLAQLYNVFFPASTHETHRYREIGVPVVRRQRLP